MAVSSEIRPASASRSATRVPSVTSMCSPSISHVGSPRWPASSSAKRSIHPSAFTCSMSTTWAASQRSSRMSDGSAWSHASVYRRHAGVRGWPSRPTGSRRSPISWYASDNAANRASAIPADASCCSVPIRHG